MSIGFSLSKYCTHSNSTENFHWLKIYHANFTSTWKTVPIKSNLCSATKKMRIFRRYNFCFQVEFDRNTVMNGLHNPCSNCIQYSVSPAKRNATSEEFIYNNRQSYQFSIFYSHAMSFSHTSIAKIIRRNAKNKKDIGTLCHLVILCP